MMYSFYVSAQEKHYSELVIHSAFPRDIKLEKIPYFIHEFDKAAVSPVRRRGISTCGESTETLCVLLNGYLYLEPFVIG